MLAPSRLRPPRQATESQKPPAVQAKSFPAPVGGLVTNENMATARSAVIMENAWATRDGVSPRRGTQEQCTVPAKVATLFQHTASGDFFAATSSAIYGFDTLSTGALTASVSGLTSGAWVTYEVQNSGGNFLLCANGANSLRRYDGTTWLTITGTGTGAITGVDTATISYVWGHRNRVFFVKKNTMSAYYLATNAIAGAATELPLGGVFRRGGSLLMGGTWSSDSGAGLDDRCIFVTDQGEVAIYSGSNPGDVNNWSLQGVYDCGKPMGRFAMASIGGDVLILTLDGIIPLSAVISKDPTQLSASSVSGAIAPTMRDAMLYYPGDWRLSKWPEGQMLIAAPMATGDIAKPVFAANMETGAWCLISGWEAGDIAPLGAGLYYGGMTGSIQRAWVGGNDNGAPYVCKIMLAPDALTDAASVKRASTMQAVFLSRASLTFTMGVTADYSQALGAPPLVSSAPDVETLSEWDVSDWDVSSWGSGGIAARAVSGWRGVSGVGFAFSPWVQILCDSSAAVEAKLQRIDVTFTPGGVHL